LIVTLLTKAASLAPPRPASDADEGLSHRRVLCARTAGEAEGVLRASGRGRAKGLRSRPRGPSLGSGLGVCRRRPCKSSTVRAGRCPRAPPLVGQRGASGGCARAFSRGALRPSRHCRSPLAAFPAWGYRTPMGWAAPKWRKQGNSAAKGIIKAGA
jgi:hypothetical protein